MDFGEETIQKKGGKATARKTSWPTNVSQTIAADRPASACACANSGTFSPGLNKEANDALPR
jgi:hypothetical protein